MGMGMFAMTVKAYICAFVSLTIEVVYLELVIDLTSQEFLAFLRCCFSGWGLPSLIWSDNGTNITRAARELESSINFSSNN